MSSKLPWNVPFVYVSMTVMIYLRCVKYHAVSHYSAVVELRGDSGRDGVDEQLSSTVAADAAHPNIVAEETTTTTAIQDGGEDETHRPRHYSRSRE